VAYSDFNVTPRNSLADLLQVRQIDAPVDQQDQHQISPVDSG
jgi:hypothetical protein